MIILSLNSGSSSVKFLIYDYDNHLTLAAGVVERVKIEGSFIKYHPYNSESIQINQECPTHKEAIKLILNTIVDINIGVLKDINQISAVGHRVVHGGDKFKKSVIIDQKVLDEFKALFDLAPLHNPPNVLGIEAAMEVLPNVPHMAIIDTAWHQTMPQHVYMYALPYEWYERYGIRRYGFHGTSFLYVSKRAAVLLDKNPFSCNLICLHIGNGVSINAVKNGISYDTSMGLTPLEGLIMGTRAGDHDPAIDLFIMEKENYNTKQMNDILNKKSGLLGITGRYSDRRDILKAAEEGDLKAKLAVEMESYRLKKYIGAYMAALGRVDAIVFTAGVGERSSLIRAKALEGLDFWGIKIDPYKNNLAVTGNVEADISAEDSKVKVFVIPTDEERVFMEDVAALLQGEYKDPSQYKYSFSSKDYINIQRYKNFEKDCEKNPQLKIFKSKL